jgi:hypothetical protein
MGQERWRWKDIPADQVQARQRLLLARPPQGGLHLRQRGTRTALRVPELVMTGSKGYFQSGLRRYLKNVNACGRLSWQGVFFTS